MKFVKGISLFFIYPAVMFSIGFFSSMLLDEYFYPGDVGIQSEYISGAEEKTVQKKDTVMETGMQRLPVVQADTKYVVVAYDVFSGRIKEEEVNTPDKFIGLNREELLEELTGYQKSPSLEDQEQGFQSIQLLSFSPDRVVVRKNYEKNKKGYYLVVVDNQVIVYDKSLTHIYMNTGIEMKNLPFSVQKEIMNMKFVETEEELFQFLESYSS